ncbi:recombination-associated protein RdgC [Vibrio sp. TBV020]|uniref:recombination-associated protein RdgC n=1 Tax=Vibrio sp. TBV020 TaxID=3137398 RepID=UPI0038CD98A1
MTVFPKNLLVYKAREGFLITETDLKNKLCDFAFVECGPQDKAKMGWTPPFGIGGVYHSHGGQNFLLKYCKQERKVNSKAFKKLFDDSVDSIEASEGRPLNKKEKDNIKDDLLIDILPTTLPQDEYIHVFIIESGQFIAIDASSTGKAETVIALLRKSLGSLPVVPLTGERPADMVITDWIRSGQTPDGICLGDSAKLQSVLEDGPKIGIKQAELTSDEVLTHIDHNAMVKEVGIDFQDRIAFSLTDDLELKKLKFSDEIKDQNDDIPREDKLARFDADLSLVFGEVKSVIEFLTQSFK